MKIQGDHGHPSRGSQGASELAEAGFVLDVTRVLAIDDGARSGHILDDWQRVLPMGGLLIRDVAGDLYRLAAPQKMDRRSKELLWAFVD